MPKFLVLLQPVPSEALWVVEAAAQLIIPEGIRTLGEPQSMQQITVDLLIGNIGIIVFILPVNIFLP